MAVPKGEEMHEAHVARGVHIHEPGIPRVRAHGTRHGIDRIVGPCVAGPLQHAMRRHVVEIIVFQRRHGSVTEVIPLAEQLFLAAVPGLDVVGRRGVVHIGGHDLRQVVLQADDIVFALAPFEPVAVIALDGRQRELRGVGRTLVVGQRMLDEFRAGRCDGVVQPFGGRDLLVVDLPRMGSRDAGQRGRQPDHLADAAFERALVGRERDAGVGPLRNDHREGMTVGAVAVQGRIDDLEGSRIGKGIFQPGVLPDDHVADLPLVLYVVALRHGGFEYERRPGQGLERGLVRRKDRLGRYGVSGDVHVVIVRARSDRRREEEQERQVNEQFGSFHNPFGF